MGIDLDLDGDFGERQITAYQRMLLRIMIMRQYREDLAEQQRLRDENDWLRRQAEALRWEAEQRNSGPRQQRRVSLRLYVETAKRRQSHATKRASRRLGSHGVCDLASTGITRCTSSSCNESRVQTTSDTTNKREGTLHAIQAAA